MGIEFDPANKWIKITSGTQISALAIYNAVMDWVDEQENMGHTVPMKAVGKAPLGGGAYSDSIFVLQYGWKIKLYNGNYQFTFFGTLITDDESPRTVQPDYGNVEVTFQVSSQGISLIQGSGVTGQDKQDIANLVWQHTKGETLSDRVNLIRKIEEGRWSISNDEFIIYDEDGETPLRKFRLQSEIDKPKAYGERVPIE